MREVVAYAAARHIEVLPELELPGHCGAALASYPHLSCKPYAVQSISSAVLRVPISPIAPGWYRFTRGLLMFLSVSGPRFDCGGWRRKVQMIQINIYYDPSFAFLHEPSEM